MNDVTEIEIDVLALVRELWKKILIIALVAILLGWMPLTARSALFI